MADLITGIVSLVIAIGFLSVLVYKVPELPLVVVILLGVAAMVASFIESARGNGNG